MILADRAVLGGAPDAASSCLDLKHLARNYADHPRRIIAAALRGVAIYHRHSCQHARRLFDLLHILRARAGSADAMDAALVEARDTIDACCAARRLAHEPPAHRPAFTVGGLVQPEQRLCRALHRHTVVLVTAVGEADALQRLELAVSPQAVDPDTAALTYRPYDLPGCPTVTVPWRRIIGLHDNW